MGMVPATVTDIGRRRLCPEQELEPDMPAEFEDAVGMVVEAGLLANPPAYLPVYEMRYAIQAMTEFPGSKALFELPSTDDPLVHYQQLRHSGLPKVELKSTPVRPRQ